MSRSEMGAGGNTQRPHPSCFKPIPKDAYQKAPPCLFCDAAPAIWLGATPHVEPNAYFCSMECAIDWINTCLGEMGIYYCVIHQCWSDELGLCPECDCVRFELPPSPEDLGYERGA